MLTDETRDTFISLFKTWLNCMWGNKLVSIITDQDGVMRKAIEIVFPHIIGFFHGIQVGMP